MALKLRFSKAENCIRSVGDWPNGILGIDCSEGSVSWSISTKFDPAGKVGAVPEERTPETDNHDLSIDELVAACATQVELGVVFDMGVQTIGLSTAVLSRRGDYPLLRAHIDLLQETHAAINKRVLEEDQAA